MKNNDLLKIYKFTNMSNLNKIPGLYVLNDRNSTPQPFMIFKFLQISNGVAQARVYHFESKRWFRYEFKIKDLKAYVR